MGELREKYSDQGVRFVSLCINDYKDKATAEEFVRVQGSKFDQWIAKDARLVIRHQIQAIPVFKLYDKNGSIVKTMVRPRPEEIEVELKVLLGN